MTAKKGVLVIASIAVGLIVSCARAPAPEPKTSATATEPTAQDTSSDQSLYAGAAEPVDACGEKSCSINAECCDGYVCGFDPDRSHVQRYCLAE